MLDFTNTFTLSASVVAYVDVQTCSILLILLHFFASLLRFFSLDMFDFTNTFTHHASDWLLVQTCWILLILLHAPSVANAVVSRLDMFDITNTFTLQTNTALFHDCLDMLDITNTFTPALRTFTHTFQFN